ncbi:MAG: YkgJ family cysteine cluster protein, partial [Kiritimatiellae bacterium]|nr:YkgJ family cysteine cluster protein [Kiritimatiellia bacterium]
MILDDGEAERLASLLGLAAYDFTARYTRLLASRRGLSLNERPDGACVFLQADNTCLVHAAKPRQCR